MYIQHSDYIIQCITRIQPSFPRDTFAIPKHVADTHTHTHTYIYIYVFKECLMLQTYG